MQPTVRKRSVPLPLLTIRSGDHLNSPISPTQNTVRIVRSTMPPEISTSKYLPKIYHHEISWGARLFDTFDTIKTITTIYNLQFTIYNGMHVYCYSFDIVNGAPNSFAYSHGWI